MLVSVYTGRHTTHEDMLRPGTEAGEAQTAVAKVGRIQSRKAYLLKINL